MRVAYIGSASGTSLHRARALERLGYTVTIVDPWSWLGQSRWTLRWLQHTGAFGVEARITRQLVHSVSAARPDFILVNQGEFIGAAILRKLSTLRVPIINYTNDNPFVGNGIKRFRYYRGALKYYDLLAIARESNVKDAEDLGARDVMHVWMTADEIAHRPRVLSAELRERYAAEVTFIGSWMPERGPFMMELIMRGVPISIWGRGWQKAPEWRRIEPNWRGTGIYDDEGYAAVVQSAKICIGLLSKENRDLHTTRSMEIPSLGNLLCAERTSEHLALYNDGSEAVFWSSAEECAALCHRLLSSETMRRDIALRGQNRALLNNHFNQPMLRAVVDRGLASFEGRRR